MKRFLLFVVAFVMTFSLAACFDNPAVQEFTREFCETNPNDEICQLDITGDLTDAQVLQVVQLILDNYDGTDVEAFCNDYISVTNQTLLDECKSTPEMFVPDGYTGILANPSIEKVSSAQGDKYVISAVSSDGLYDIVFTIQLVKENEIPYVFSWEVSKTLITVVVECPAPKVIIDGECTDAPPLTCNTGEVLVGDECKAIADTCLTGEIVVDNECVPATTTCNVNEILVENNCISTIVTFSQAKTFLESFIAMYLDDTIASLPFCTEYFVNDPSGCIEDRDEGLAENANITLDTIVALGDGVFATELTMYDNPTDTVGEYNYQQFKFHINPLGELVMEFVDNRLSMAEAKIVFAELLTAYLNPLMTIEQIEAKFFTYEMPEGFAEDRAKTLIGTASFVLGDITEDEGLFKLEMTMTEEGNTETTYILFMAYMTGPDTYHIEILGDEPDISLEDAYLRAMFNSYLDSSILSTDFCNMYFDPQDNTDCAENRDQDILKLSSLSIEYIGFKDGYIMAGIKLVNIDMSEEYMEFIVFFNFDVNDEIIGVQFEEPMNQEYVDFIYMMVDDFNDYTLDHTTACSPYFDSVEIQGCIEKRIEVHASNGTLNVEYMNLRGDHNELGLRFITDTEDYTENIIAHFSYDNTNMLKVKFEGNNHYEFPFDQAETFINQMIIDFNDPALSDADFCYKYFEQTDSTTCFLDLSMLQGNAFVVAIDFLELHENAFMMGITITDTVLSQTYPFVIDFVLYHNDNNEIMIEWWYHQDDFGVPYDDAYNLVVSFLNDINNSALTDDDFSIKYCENIQDYNCVNMRQNLMNYSGVAQLINFDLRGKDAFIEVMFEELNTDSYYEYLRVEFFYVNDMLFMHLDYDQPYFEFDFNKAFNHFDQVINNFNDYSKTNEEACSMIPNFFADCYQFRQAMMDNNQSLLFSNFWRENQGNFGVQLMMVDSTTTYESYYFSLFFFYDEDNNVMFNWVNEYPDFVHATLEEATILFTQFIADYMDPTITNEVLADMYMNGHSSEDFFEGRAEQIANGTTYSLVSMIADDVYGPFAYHFILEVTTNGMTESIDDYVMFKIFPDFTIIEFVDTKGQMVDITTAENLVQMFFEEIRNNTDDTTVCTMYFSMEDANPCIQMVSTVFRMYPSFDLFMIEHFEDGFLVGVDYYDIDGYMVDTYYFKVYIYDGDNGFYMFMHVTEDPYQFNQDFYNHMNLLGTLLMDIPTNMTQICDEFFYMITDCATELQPYLTTELTGAYQTEFFSRFDEFNNESFYARIRFEYSDGSWIHNEYLVYFEYHETLGLRASLELRGSEMSIPSDAVFQPLTQTTNILTQFVNGYQNSTVSDDDLCHTFFMDSTMNGECLEGRAEFLLASGTATLTSIEELFDTEGVEYYLAHFTLTTGTETEEIYQAVRVYLLSNGLFYIDFLDMQPEISLDDFVARYTKYLLEWNDHFNTTSGVCAEFFEINDSSCAPNRDAAIAANGVLTAVEYYNIEIINDVIYYSVSISVMYSDVTQNESGYEVYTAHYGDSGEIVFVPANFPN